jgi:osmotically-inducible protein OsmY
MSALSMELNPHLDANDEVLAQRIRNHLMTKHRLAERKLSVEVNDKVATIRGQATSYYQRQLWLHEVKSFKDLDGVVDLIEVA